jgi:flagella basal body P-ring formation protein FlgA
MPLHRLPFLAGLVALVAVAPSWAAADSDAPGVRAAIEEAVRERMGAGVTVRVSGLRLDATPSSDAIRAKPDPAARTGRPVRFTLMSGGRRVGGAVARVDVFARHARARQAIARDIEIGAGDVDTVDGDVLAVRFDPLPSAAEAVGQRVRRALAAGEVITTAVIEVPAAVRTGDEVRARVRVGAVEAWGAGRAWGSGRIGDVIRITRGPARTTLRARIVAPGIVEILQ